jgi:hypothetical protein
MGKTLTSYYPLQNSHMGVIHNFVTALGRASKRDGKIKTLFEPSYGDMAFK